MFGRKWLRRLPGVYHGSDLAAIGCGILGTQIVFEPASPAIGRTSIEVLAWGATLPQIHTPYDYSTRTGVERLGWDAFGALTRTLVERIAPLKPDLVVGIARAGLIPATAVACALCLDLAPVRLTRRERDVVVRERPRWLQDVPAYVAGRRVVVIDEIASTGETLALAADRVRKRGAEWTATAALAAHTWASPMPDVVAQIGDALLVFPWDAEVLVDGNWQINPELAQAIRTLGEA